MVKFCHNYWEELENNILSLQRNSREGSEDSMPKIEKIEAKRRKLDLIAGLWNRTLAVNKRTTYSNHHSCSCTCTAYQGLSFFLLQLTRNLTVHNHDDSALTYVILGTHLCHATVCPHTVLHIYLQTCLYCFTVIVYNYGPPIAIRL